MFFEDKRPKEVIKEELALSDFNLEDHDYLDPSVINVMFGRAYSRWYFHFILGLLFYFLVGLFFFPIFFLFIFIDLVYYVNDSILDEELLSFEFYWILYDFMVEMNGADFRISVCSFYIYNELGMVIWGLNPIDDYGENLYLYDFTDNKMGFSNNFHKLEEIKVKNSIVDINDYNVLDIDRLVNFKDKFNLSYSFSNVKDYYYINCKIRNLLTSSKIIKNSNYKFYFFYNKDRGLTWYDFIKLFYK